MWPLDIWVCECNCACLLHVLGIHTECLHMYMYVYKLIYVYESVCIYIYVHMRAWNCVRMCILVYTYVYVCTWVYTYVSVYSGVCLACIYVYMYVLVACYSVLNPFGELRTSYRTSDPIQVRVVVDPIQWGFEDRSIGWSVDQYQFVQWRPDGDSVPKLRHFNVSVSLSLSLSLPLFIKWPQILFYMLCKLLSRFLMLHVYVWRSPSVKADGHLPFIFTCWMYRNMICMILDTC